MSNMVSYIIMAATGTALLWIGVIGLIFDIRYAKASIYNGSVTLIVFGNVLVLLCIVLLLIAHR